MLQSIFAIVSFMVGEAFRVFMAASDSFSCSVSICRQDRLSWMLLFIPFAVFLAAGGSSRVLSKGLSNLRLRSAGQASSAALQRHSGEVQTKMHLGEVRGKKSKVSVRVGRAGG